MISDEERQKLTERLNEVKRMMMLYSNTGCEEYLALVKEYQELTEKLGIIISIDQLDKVPSKYSEGFDTIKTVETFIVNQLGINLCSVAEIKVDKQDDGQLKEISIKFKPDNG